MNVDTGQFRAITAENDQMRSDLTLMVRALDKAFDCLDALGCHPAPVLTVVAGSGRGRHARPRRRHLRAVSSGQP